MSWTDPIGPLSGDALLAAVTDAMIVLHLHHYARVPRTVKTQLLGDDLLACVMGGVYAEVEQTMIELQRGDVIHENRGVSQPATRQEFVDAVEQLSGRQVIAFISNHHLGPDRVVELFFLEPDPA